MRQTARLECIATEISGAMVTPHSPLGMKRRYPRGHAPASDEKHGHAERRVCYGTPLRAWPWHPDFQSGVKWQTTGILTVILVAIVALIGIALQCSAEDSVTFPLQGYYHPGKYVPVQVHVSPRSAEEISVHLDSPGSVWTFVRFEGGAIDTTVPWLPMDARAKELSWYVHPRKGGDLVRPALKPLGENQRIIGYAGVEAAAAISMARTLFPGDELLPIALNPSLPLPGIAAAWQTLDAVILNASAIQRVGEARFASLVAEGVAFAVAPGNGPDAVSRALWPHWPWKNIDGGWWVIQYKPSGPVAATYSDAIYEPVAAWRSGWPLDVRVKTCLLGGVFSILILLLALGRPRLVAVWAMVLSGAFLGGLYTWGKSRKPTLTCGGKIRIISPGITQDDDWAYETCHQNTTSTIRWVDTTRLVFASPAQLDACVARLVCYPNGDPDYLFLKLRAKTKIALLSRRCGPQAPSVIPSPAITSPLSEVAKNLYLRTGDRMIGELPSTPLIGEPYSPLIQWPGIMIKRN